MTLRLSGVARWAALAFLLVVSAVARPALADPTFPALTGRVVDQADILSAADEASLTTKLAALETQNTDQLVVVTVSSLQGYAIEDYGYKLGRHWQIGQAGANNGVILLVAPNERKVRIEVGYGVEGVLTDAYSSLIIQREILPRFRNNDYPGGIIAGTDAIIEQLTLDPAEAQTRADRAASSSGSSNSPEDWIFIAVILLVVAPHVFVLLAVMGLFGGKARKWARTSGRSWTSGSSSGSSWSSGSSGGFSGGGGSFGGGGSSGGW